MLTTSIRHYARRAGLTRRPMDFCPTIGSWTPRRVARDYHCVDEYRRLPGPAGRARRMEEALVRRADLVLASYGRWRERGGEPSHAIVFTAST